MISLHKITKVYPPNTLALENISLEIKERERVIITGRSGAGKTTLLKIIYCLLRPTYGQVRINGQDISSVSERKREAIRRTLMGMAFQERKLIKKKSVLENIILPLKIKGIPNKEALKIAKEILAIGRIEHLAYRKAFQLSEGEKQKVNILRAISHKPQVLLIDEPLQNLDPPSREEIIQLLALVQEQGSILIIATHDLELAEKIGGRIVHLERGRIVNLSLNKEIVF